jgi:hypothetical protein
LLLQEAHNIYYIAFWHNDNAILFLFLLNYFLLLTHILT